MFDVRRGAPFQIIALRQIRYGGVYQGGPIFKQLPAPTYTPYTGFTDVRRGAPFINTTGNENINAQDFDFYYRGGPYWAESGEVPPPVGFNAATFFMVF